MPTYRYECKSCLHRFEEFCSIAASESIPCEKCQGKTMKLMSPVNLNFPGDDWVSKNLRIKKQMREKNQLLNEKQKERQFYDRGKIPTLAPNVNGERVDSWSDAQKLAKDKGLNTSSYDKMVHKEKVDKTK